MKRKNIILTILIGFTTLSIYAQSPRIKKEKNDTTVFLWSGLKILVFNDPNADTKADTNVVHIAPKPPRATFYEGIDLGVNGLMNSGAMNANLTGSARNLDLDYSGSWNMHLNIVEKQMSIYKKQVNIITGLGIDYNGYRFNAKNVKLTNDVTNNQIRFDSVNNRELTKNKLRVSSIEVPLMIGFATSKKNPDKGFKVAVGVIGSYIYNSKYKLNFTEDKASTEQVIKDNFHLRPFNVKATARVGYKGLMLFANYSLLSMFKDGQGPDVRPFEIGISL